MSCECDNRRERLLAILQKRAAAGQIDRRGCLELAVASGLGSVFAAAMADQVIAAPVAQGLGERSIAYDYIVVGAGSAGCTIAAHLSEDASCRVLLIEAGGTGTNRLALQSPLLSPANFKTDVDWAYQTTPQTRAAGRVIDWPRGKVIGGSSSINAMIWLREHAADFDQWAYAGSQGWNYARLKPVFQSIETCARKSSGGDRGTNGPMHVEPVSEPSLTALCAAVEHSRAIGLAPGLSESRKREIATIPQEKGELKEFVARITGSHWHPVGTCAMGVHQEAVVDPLLRVYGTTNLRVTDASIMPTITSGNTNAPTIVIAERASQMITGSK